MKKNNILIWGNNWIGDVICSIPSVIAVKTTYPESRITMVVRRPSEELIGLLNEIDEVIAFSKDEPLLKTFRTVIELRKRSFDIAFVFPNSFRSALLTFLSGAKIRIGHKKEARNIFFTQPVTPPKEQSTHLSDMFLNIVRSGSCNYTEKEVNIKIPADDAAFARSYIYQLVGKKVKAPPIIVHIGASKLPRAWNIEKFAELLKILSDEYEICFVVIGTPDELDHAGMIKDVLGTKVLLAFKRFTLSQLCALMKESMIFIGNDSGMMHLASILGLYTIAIFGPDRPERTGAFINKEKFLPVSKNFPCSPCRQKFFYECSPSDNGKAPCIEAISTNDVLNTVKAVIKQIM